MDPLGGSNYQRNAACGGNSADQGVERHWRERTIKGSLKKIDRNNPYLSLYALILAIYQLPYRICFLFRSKSGSCLSAPFPSPYEVGAHEGGGEVSEGGFPYGDCPLWAPLRLIGVYVLTPAEGGRTRLRERTGRKAWFCSMKAHRVFGSLK
jgi:hypothetical protein